MEASARSIQGCLLWPLLVVVCTWSCCFLTPTAAKIDDPVQYCQALQPSPTLEQFVDKLPKVKQIRIDHGKQVTIGAYKILQKLHRDLPPTTLYAYGTSAATASLPGPTLVTTEGVQSYVRWENHINDDNHMLAVDNTVMWAAPKRGGVPIVTHLHGGECDSDSDGYPDSWHTARGEYGPTYKSKNYTYANNQAPAMLWYHDHTFGITRVNVLSGLAGFYLIKPKAEPAWLPKRTRELHLLLQDKQFFHNGSINFPNVGDSPQNHPQWCPEYFGDTILVNGKAWPYIKVARQKYRIRFLNGANARVFVLSLSHPNVSFIQIGTDGGLLHKSQAVATLTLAPAERIDCIIDFALVAADTEIVLNNSGAAPFPSGDPSFSPPSTAAVMKFIVKKGPAHSSPAVPAVVGAPYPALNLNSALVRQHFMVEVDDVDGNPLYSLLSNHTWRDPVTELPLLGATEVWEFVNLTPDAHPMHIHLVEFRALDQQPFDLDTWSAGGCRIFNSSFGENHSCFTAGPQAPSPNQVGWKDTVLSLPGHVTRVVVRWASRDGPFRFDATAGPGYVWHCHILDHEDNDMMRPIKLVKRSR